MWLLLSPWRPHIYWMNSVHFMILSSSNVLPYHSDCKWHCLTRVIEVGRTWLVSLQRVVKFLITCANLSQVFWFLLCGFEQITSLLLSFHDKNVFQRLLKSGIEPQTGKEETKESCTSCPTHLLSPRDLGAYFSLLLPPLSRNFLIGEFPLIPNVAYHPSLIIPSCY